MEQSCISLEKRLDAHTQMLMMFDHHLHNSGFSVLGPRGLWCSGVAKAESLSTLCPSQRCLHPETGWPRAKFPGAGVAGGLLCGHLKHRASLSLKAAPFPCFREGQICFCRADGGAPWPALPARYAGSAQAMAAPCCPSASRWLSHGPARCGVATSGKGSWRWYLAGMEPMPTTVGICSCGTGSLLAAHHLSLCARAVSAPLARLREEAMLREGARAELSCGLNFVTCSVTQEGGRRVHGEGVAFQACSCI